MDTATRTSKIRSVRFYNQAVDMVETVDVVDAVQGQSLVKLMLWYGSGYQPHNAHLKCED